MKTILFISPTGTLDNGAEISIFNLMKFLVSKGYKVINVAPTSDHAKEREYTTTFEQQGINCVLIKSQRWWWEEAPPHLFGTKEERATSYRETIARINQLILAEDVDLVISNTVNVFQGAIAASLVDKPHFWMVHEFPANEFSYYTEKIDFIDTYSTQIFAVTGQLQKKIAELFPDRHIGSFLPFTDSELIELPSAKKNRLVSIGRLTERKNQLELIQAYQQLDNTENELIFIGGWDEAYKKKCTNYIKENKLKNIHFLGNKENPWHYVTDQDICVFSSSMETFGLVYVEALLNGVPVIVSDNPGHISAYQLFDFGTLYTSGNLDELVDTIKRTLENFSEEKKRAEEFVEQARDKYQLSISYQELIEAIETNQGNIPTTSNRHLADLLTLNEKKSKLSFLEYRVRHKLQRILFRVFRR